MKIIFYAIMKNVLKLNVNELTMKEFVIEHTLYN